MASRRATDVRLIVFACEAGMGSSLIGANQLKKRLSGRDIRVIHAPVSQIPTDTDIVVAHESLGERARKAAPSAVVLTFKNFMKNDASDLLVRRLDAGEDVADEGGHTA
jgi:mannitol-specific phosphotransferase system IIBC component